MHIRTLLQAQLRMMLCMRLATPLLLIACFATPLLFAQTLHAQTQPASLEAELKAIAAAHHGSVALYAENLRTHQTVALDPDRPVQTASVIKLGILYEALEQMHAGKVHWDDQLVLTSADEVLGSGVLHLLDAPLTLTFKDVLTLMIVMSDNAATNLAIDHLGLAAIDARLQDLGLQNTWLYKKIFTPNLPGAVMPADQPRFGLGKSTPREMATLMGKLIHCELAEPGSPKQAADATLCQTALIMLQTQFYRGSIPRYLDGMPGATGTSIANKTGSLEAVRADVAAVSTPNGMVLLSIFTYDNHDHSWGVDQEGELTIAKLARAIIATWSPAGLAAWPQRP